MPGGRDQHHTRAVATAAVRTDFLVEKAAIQFTKITSDSACFSAAYTK
jgi:hypothetical protein